MGFADEVTVMEEIESLIVHVWNEMLPEARMATPFPRMTYYEAMSSYGSDKPDLRYSARVSSEICLVVVTHHTKIPRYNQSLRSWRTNSSIK